MSNLSNIPYEVQEERFTDSKLEWEEKKELKKIQEELKEW